MGFIVLSHMKSPNEKNIYDGKGTFLGFNCCGLTVCKDVEISKNFKRPLILGKIRRHLY